MMGSHVRNSIGITLRTSRFNRVTAAIVLMDKRLRFHVYLRSWEVEVLCASFPINPISWLAVT